MSQFNSVPTGPIDAPVNIMNPTGIDPNAAMAQMGDLSNRRNQREMANQQAGLQRQQMAQQQQQFDASQQQERNLQAAGMAHDKEMNRISTATAWELKRLEILQRERTEEWNRANTLGDLERAEQLRKELIGNFRRQKDLTEKLSTITVIGSGVNKNLNPNDPASAGAAAILKRATEQGQSYMVPMNEALREIAEALTGLGTANSRVMEDPNNPGNFFVSNSRNPYSEGLGQYEPKIVGKGGGFFGNDFSKAEGATKNGQEFVRLFNEQGLDSAVRFLEEKHPDVSRQVVLVKDPTTGSVMTRSALVDKRNKPIVFLSKGSLADRDPSFLGSMFDREEAATKYASREDALKEGFASSEDFAPNFDKLGAALHKYLVQGRKYDNNALQPGILIDIIEDMYLLSTNPNAQERFTTSLSNRMKGIEKDMNDPAEFSQFKKDLGLFFNLVEKTASQGDRVQLQGAMNAQAMAQGQMPFTFSDTDRTPGVATKFQNVEAVKKMVDYAKATNIFGPEFNDGIIELQDGVLPDMSEAKIAYSVLQAMSGAGDNVELLRMLKSGQLPENVKQIMLKADLGSSEQKFLTDLLQGIVVSGIQSAGKSVDVLDQMPGMTRQEIESQIEELQQGAVGQESQEMLDLRKARTPFPSILPEMAKAYEFLNLGGD